MKSPASQFFVLPIEAAFHALSIPFGIIRPFLTDMQCLFLFCTIFFLVLFLMCIMLSFFWEQLRILREGHRARVCALDWNNHILTTGGMDSNIVNNDVRVSSHIVGTYTGHNQEVCGLKWSGSGKQLASGGNDNLVYIWSITMAASSSSGHQWVHRLEDHTAAVKALAWCPFQSNLLASGGGSGDHSIKFWNSNTGACLNSVNAGSQVCSLLWNRHEREILSSHGMNDNQLTLWKYPSMVKIAELYGHTSRVLSMAQVLMALPKNS